MPKNEQIDAIVAATPSLQVAKRNDEMTANTARVAIDDGFARIKLIGETADGKLGILSFPSSVRSGLAGSLSSIHGDGRKVGFYRTEEGQTFTVSPDIAGEGTRFDDFHVSQVDRVLVHHALLQAGFSGRKVILMTSLPVNEYYRNGDRNTARIRAKAENLMKGVTSDDGRAMAEIVDVKVGCQALAAYFDLTLQDDGLQVISGLGSVAVVDIGGSTTDIAVILNGLTLDDNRTGNIKTGVLDVHAAIARRLSKEKNVGDQNYPATMMENALRTRRIRLHGEEHDISTIVQESIDEVAEKLLRDISLKIGNAALLDRVFFVGGGASVFGHIAGQWKNGVVADTPGFANARGLLKFARAFDSQN